MKSTKLLIISLICVCTVIISGCDQVSKDTNIEKEVVKNDVQQITQPIIQPETTQPKVKAEPVVTPKPVIVTSTSTNEAIPEVKKEVVPEVKEISETTISEITPEPVVVKPVEKPIVTAIACGSNFQCFIDAAKECKPATVARIDTSDLSDFSKVIAYDHKLLEIKGVENNNCITRFYHEKTTAKYSDNQGGDPTSAENIAYATKEADTLYGYSKSANVIDIKCKFSSNDQLVKLLTKWNATTEGLAKTDMTDMGCIDY